MWKVSDAYRRDESTGVWRRSDFNGLAYSDGDQHEDYLRGVIANAQDISSWSPELIAAIRDWPSEYHLSPVRHNLLRPFEFGSNHTVLELGGGCGAMTRYLGEHVGRVVCVEGSPRRAEIAALRCRDLASVEVYCDALDEFDTDERFDFVLLIGVLEYATKYGKGDDPALECLRSARRFLKPSGHLVLAIENKLGLKYFAGCGEDHIGVPFVSVGDLYDRGDVATYGRRELIEKFDGAGFREVRFFYPFPDYKVPTVILAEDALGAPVLNCADLLLLAESRDYAENRYRTFDDQLAWRSVHRNGLVQDLANSFLVFAANSDVSYKSEWLACAYNRTIRASRYARGLRIVKDAVSGGLFVEKRKIFSERSIREIESRVPYIEGRLVVGDVRRVIARGGGVGELASVFLPWLRLLVENSTVGPDGRLMLPSNFVDCTPLNVIRPSSGVGLHYFDDEWSAQEPIPTAWVVIRGVLQALNGCLDAQGRNQLSMRQFACEIAQRAGLDLRSDDFKEAANLEKAFCMRASGVERWCADLNLLYDQLPSFYIPFTRYRPGRLERLGAALDRVRLVRVFGARWGAFRRWFISFLQKSIGEYNK